MLRLAILFPGQGAQYIGMGRDLAREFAVAREVFQRADDALGVKLSRICFAGEQPDLDRTEITQPAVLTASIAVWEVLKQKGVNAEIAAGLSLGEYSALVAAGAIDLETGVRLVARRAKIMQEAVPEGRGMMAAVLGFADEVVEEACKKAGSAGEVGIANYNCPGQMVISGEKAAVLEAGRYLQKAGGRFVPLKVSVPSHSRLMAEAAEELRTEIRKVEWGEMSFPVISNVTARELDCEELEQRLVEQLYRPVRWQQSIEYMSSRVDYFIEAGPGRTLSGLVKKTSRHHLIGSVEDPGTLAQVMKKLGEAGRPGNNPENRS